MYNGKTVAAVVPAYNEENLIADTIKSVPDYIDKVYVVNDGSRDRTAEIVSAFTNDRIKLINHPVNKGVGGAIVTGYKSALDDNMDIAVVMAGDNQMDPDNLSALLAPIIFDVADYTKGDRLSKSGFQKGMTPWRRLGNFLLTWLTRIAAGNRRIQDPQNGYTAITNEALKKINLDDVYPWYGYCNDMLVKMSAYKMRIMDVPMPARYGLERSKIRYHKYIPRVSWLLLRLFFWRLRFTVGKNTNLG